MAFQMTRNMVEIELAVADPISWYNPSEVDVRPL